MLIKKLIIVLYILTLLITPVYAMSNQIDIIYFYSDGCSSCQELKPLLEGLSKDKDINIIKYSTDNLDTNILQKEYATIYNVSDNDSYKIPAIYIGDKSFIGLNKIEYNLLPEIQLIKEDYSIYKRPVINSSIDKESFFKTNSEEISITGIIIAGLIDGFNPCAISVLMVFCSFLIFRGKQKQIVPISIVFIIGSFMSNFLIGLGLLTFFKAFSTNNIFILIIYIISIILCLIAFCVNSIDIYNGFKKASCYEFKNQLKTDTKFKISGILQRSVGKKLILLSSFLAGFIVGFMEFSCTGQIYIPTLTYMIQEHLSINYILLLLLYNLMFIVPLIIATLIILKVKEPENIKGAIMNKSHYIKIIGNIFFIIMILILINKIIKIV